MIPGEKFTPKLKCYENGAHRVQRVPVTESQKVVFILLLRL